MPVCLSLAAKVYAMDLLIILSIPMALALAAVVVLARRLAFTDTCLPLTAEWIDELSIERYRPMMHLLDAADLESLRAQPGFTPEMAAKVRIERSEEHTSELQSLRH